MNLKSIIASIVLAASSTAMAAPAVAASARVDLKATSARVDLKATAAVVRDHRTDTTYDKHHGVISPPIIRQPAREPVRAPVHQAPVYAQPAQPIGWNDHRGGWSRPPVYRTVTLGNALNFANDGRTFITVGSQAGTFAQLQLSAAGGRTYIEEVYVQFANGQERVIRSINRTLAGSAELTLDLDGNRRAIKRIVVYGKNLNGASARRATSP